VDYLTKKQAYAAMYLYLEAVYDRTSSDGIGAMLGGMSLLADGGTADPAVWPDWEEAVRKALQEVPMLGLDISGR
jgi:hypothetical protein